MFRSFISGLPNRLHGCLAHVVYFDSEFSCGLLKALSKPDHLIFFLEDQCWASSSPDLYERFRVNAELMVCDSDVPYLATSLQAPETSAGDEINQVHAESYHIYAQRLFESYSSEGQEQAPPQIDYENLTITTQNVTHREELGSGDSRDAVFGSQRQESRWPDERTSRDGGGRLSPALFREVINDSEHFSERHDSSSWSDWLDHYNEAAYDRNGTVRGRSDSPPPHREYHEGTYDNNPRFVYIVLDFVHLLIMF